MAETINPVIPILESAINDNPDILDSLTKATSKDAFIGLTSTFATNTGIPFKKEQLATAIDEDELLNPFKDMDQMMTDKDYNNAAGITNIDASITDSGSWCGQPDTSQNNGCPSDTSTGRYCNCPSPTTKDASCTCGLFCW